LPRRDAGPIAADAVRVVEWPSGTETIEALARAGTPRLVLVDAGSDPPEGSDCYQDWMWRTGSEREMRLRLQQLSLRALAHGHDRPYIDSIGLLHVGLRSVPLSPKERALAAVLVERFNGTVAKDELVRAAWPGGIRNGNVLSTRMTALRARIAWVGLEIVGSSRRGYAMVPMPGSATPAESIGFEDELEAADLLVQARSGRAVTPARARAWPATY
jgi:two-component system, OmpR family, response regulator